MGDWSCDRDMEWGQGTRDRDLELELGHAMGDLGQGHGLWTGMEPA